MNERPKHLSPCVIGVDEEGHLTITIKDITEQFREVLESLLPADEARPTTTPLDIPDSPTWGNPLVQYTCYNCGEESVWFRSRSDAVMINWHIDEDGVYHLCPSCNSKTQTQSKDKPGVTLACQRCSRPICFASNEDVERFRLLSAGEILCGSCRKEMVNE